MTSFSNQYAQEYLTTNNFSLDQLTLGLVDDMRFFITSSSKANNFSDSDLKQFGVPVESFVLEANYNGVEISLNDLEWYYGK